MATTALRDNGSQDFTALMLRVQARRVAAVWEMAGREHPPGAQMILHGDTEEQIEADNAAFRAWCCERGLESIEWGPNGFRAEGLPEVVSFPRA